MHRKTPVELRRCAREILAACEFVTDIKSLIALLSLALSYGEKAQSLERAAKARNDSWLAWQAKGEH